MALANGAEIFRPDTAKELLFHMRQVHRYNASLSPSQEVAIDTEFDADHDSRRNIRPILRLIGMWYTTITGQASMFLLDMMEVDEMNKRDTN